MNADDDAFQPLSQTPPLRDLVHQRLESLIIDGSIPLGAKLREGELASTLGVSRGPIREALQILAQDGYVDLRPRQGAFVHVFDRREIEDLFDVRTLLEGESAHLAALRAKAGDHDRLRKVVAETRRLRDRAEISPRGAAWMRIHAEIAAVAENALLGKTLGSLEKRFRWHLSPYEQSKAEATLDEHASIVEAIADGDADRARDEMIAHIGHSREALIQRVEKAYQASR